MCKELYILNSIFTYSVRNELPSESMNKRKWYNFWHRLYDDYLPKVLPKLPMVLLASPLKKKKGLFFNEINFNKLQTKHQKVMLNFSNKFIIKNININNFSSFSVNINIYLLQMIHFPSIDTSL